MAYTITSNDGKRSITIKRRKADYVEPVSILTAAKALLAKLDNMTTDDFSKGGESKEREALRAAIEAASK